MKADAATTIHFHQTRELSDTVTVKENIIWMSFGHLDDQNVFIGSRTLAIQMTLMGKMSLSYTLAQDEKEI